MLFVIAVVQLVRASASFIDQFIDDEPDHGSKYGDDEKF
jgi:hypothetical protein